VVKVFTILQRESHSISIMRSSWSLSASNVLHNASLGLNSGEADQYVVSPPEPNPLR
jgi:hypothetical protein